MIHNTSANNCGYKQLNQNYLYVTSSDMSESNSMQVSINILPVVPCKVVVELAVNVPKCKHNRIVNAWKTMTYKRRFQ